MVDAIALFGIIVLVVVVVICIGSAYCYRVESRRHSGRAGPGLGLDNPTFRGKHLSSVHLQDPSDPAPGAPDKKDSPDDFITAENGVAYDRARSNTKGEYANSPVAADASENVPEKEDDPNVYKVATSSLKRSSVTSKTSATSNPPGYEAPPTFDDAPPKSAPKKAASAPVSDTDSEDINGFDSLSSTGSSQPEPVAPAPEATIEAAPAEFEHGQRLSRISEGPEKVVELKPSFRRSVRRRSIQQLASMPRTVIEEPKPKLREPPFGLPALPTWMQPKAHNPWKTMRRRPLYRTVVVQRDSNDDLGFGLGIKAGSNPVVRRTKDPWLPDTVLDGDEILGVKGTSATNENVAELFKTAGTTGAGFSVDVIRYINDVETRAGPKPASDGDRAKIPAEVGARLDVDESTGTGLVDGVGEAVALQVASIGDKATRLQTARPLLAGGKERAEFIEALKQCPARHVAVADHDGPDNRRLLRFPTGATITVHEKREDGWWGGTYNGDAGWFPSHAVNPIEADIATDLATDRGGTVSFMEPGQSDPLYQIPGWWEPDTFPDPMQIPWATLLPNRGRVSDCRREPISSADGGGYRFVVFLADGSKSELEVVPTDAGSSGNPMLITEEWTPVAQSAQSARSVGTLRRYATRFSSKVIEFCKCNDGAVVDDGSPRALVECALRAAGARPAVNNNFGQVITEVEAAEGDLVLFERCAFRGTGPDGANYAFGRGVMSTPHVAVVQSREGRVFTVWEAGVNGRDQVTTATYNMMHLREGVVSYFRALPTFSTIKPKHRK